MERTGKASIATAISVSVLLVVIPATYLGGYYALLVAPTYQQLANAPYGEMESVPEYHVGGSVLAKVLYPAHRLDRVVRPAYWVVPPSPPPIPPW